MVRPRLVEEGKPLSLSRSDTDHNNTMNGHTHHHQPHYAVTAAGASDGASHRTMYASSLSGSQGGGRDVPGQTAAAGTASSSSSSSSSLLQAVARTQTDAQHRHSFRQQPLSSTSASLPLQSHRTVIGEYRGDTTQERSPPASHHQQRQCYASQFTPASSLAATAALHHPPDPIQPSRPHRTHYEIGRMEEDDDEEEGGGGAGRNSADADFDDVDMTGGDVAEDEFGPRHTRGPYGEAPASPVRMEGVEDHSVPTPLVVLDGANVAYEYGGAARVLREGAVDAGGGRRGASSAATADARGMLVASEYFVRHGVRVKVVLPASWFRRKPNAHDPDRSNARMQTDEQDALAELQRRGLLVASPPADDDDAYAIALARRESARTVQRCRALHHQLDPTSFPVGQMGGAFVISNDMFRDAQDRDPTLRSWLTMGEVSRGGRMDGATSRLAHSASSSSSSSGNCPGRISYTFVDVGTMDDHGDPQLDFLPNPRHPLISWLEARLRSFVP